MFLLAFALINSSKYQILLDSLEAKAQRLGIDRLNYIANANNLIIKKMQKKLLEKVNFAIDICPRVGLLNSKMIKSHMRTSIFIF